VQSLYRDRDLYGFRPVTPGRTLIRWSWVRAPPRSFASETDRTRPGSSKPVITNGLRPHAISGMSSRRRLMTVGEAPAETEPAGRVSLVTLTRVFLTIGSTAFGG